MDLRQGGFFPPPTPPGEAAVGTVGMGSRSVPLNPVLLQAKSKPAVRCNLPKQNTSSNMESLSSLPSSSTAENPESSKESCLNKKS